ncbi:MAG: hypothetical protein KGY81_03635 [Phycisphaerae bacterium]|nr:hypothetical protein [Phycisphaerae bacterium]
MKRKLTLLIGCFLLLLLAFGTYRLFLPDAVAWQSHVRTSPTTFDPVDPNSPSFGQTSEVTFYDRSAEGALRGVYRADSWKKEDDGSFTLERPNAEVYLPDGKRVYLSADRGRIWAQEVADGFNIRYGRMEGTVEIYFDQSTALDRIHPRERRFEDWQAYQNEVMRIRTRNIEFNRDMLEIYTPNRVTVWSKDLDLVGSDLRIHWNESPRELRRLKLAVVDVMIIKQLPAPMDPLPIGEEGEQEASPPVEAPTVQSAGAGPIANASALTPLPPGEVASLRAGEGSCRCRKAPSLTCFAGHRAQGKRAPADAGPRVLAYYPASSVTLVQQDGETTVEDAWNLPEENEAAEQTEATAEERTPAAEAADEADQTPADTAAETPGPDTTEPEAAPTPAQNAPAVARNIYRATCTEDVRVYAEQRSVVGAEEVSWTFEWTGGWRGDEEPQPNPGETPVSVRSEPQPEDEPADIAEEGTTVTPRVEPNEASAPAETDDTGSTDDAGVDVGSGAVAADSADRERPAEPVEDVGHRMEIYCDGPLVIEPIGATDQPSGERYRLAGKGERVILRNEEARVLCKSFDYANASRTARVRGDSKTPTRLVLNRGDEIICRDEIEIIGDENVAYLRGRGTLNRFAEPTTESAWESILAGEADRRTIRDQIFWAGHVEIGFAEQPARDDAGRIVREPGGEPTTRMFIKDATFHKNVQLARRVEAEDSSGGPADYDYVKCERLGVQFETTETGSTYPSQADASGNVQARQEGSNIVAQNATVWFRPVAGEGAQDAADDDAPADDQDPDGPMAAVSGARVEATRLLASGKVSIKDKPTANDPARFVQADRLDADLLNRRATLVGKPARMKEGPNKIVGEEIVFREVAENQVGGQDAPRVPMVDVRGAGSLEFFTDQGMGGEELRQPRHMRVKWTRSMAYDGQAGRATFDGGVALDSGDDEMRASRMTLHFHPVDHEKKADGERPADAAEPNRLAMGVESYSSRDIDRIVISGSGDEEALLKRTRFDPAMPQVMLQRIELRGQKVIYTAGVEDPAKPEQTTGNTVEVVGSGRFSHEDYQPPTKTQRNSDDDMQLQRPSQTACVWTGGMLMDQTTNHIKLRDGVTMVYRSGDEVLKIKGLRTPPWGKLPEGRVSKIRCEELDAWFAKAAETPAKPAEGGDVMQGMQAMGPLETFRATRDVTVVDGPITIDAQRVAYDARQKIVNVWGYLEGQRKADARISRVDPATGRTSTNASSELHWVMPQDGRPEKIVTGRIRAGGGV